MTVLDDVAAERHDGPWVDVCAATDVLADRGVCALIEGVAVALFRCSGRSVEGHDRWFAVDNRDPFTGASVLSRGLVGSAGDRVTVASPLLKQRFDLATGQCIDDVAMTLGVWPIRVVDGRVEVGTEPSSTGNQRETGRKHQPATMS